MPLLHVNVNPSIALRNEWLARALGYAQIEELGNAARRMPSGGRARLTLPELPHNLGAKVRFRGGFVRSAAENRLDRVRRDRPGTIGSITCHVTLPTTI